MCGYISLNVIGSYTVKYHICTQNTKSASLTSLCFTQVFQRETLFISLHFFGMFFRCTFPHAKHVFMKYEAEYFDLLWLVCDVSVTTTTTWNSMEITSRNSNTLHCGYTFSNSFEYTCDCPYELNCIVTHLLYLGFTQNFMQRWRVFITVILFFPYLQRKNRFADVKFHTLQQKWVQLITVRKRQMTSWQRKQMCAPHSCSERVLLKSNESGQRLLYWNVTSHKGQWPLGGGGPEFLLQVLLEIV